LHFEKALEMNAQGGGRPWVAHTLHGYAQMLLARGEPRDGEQALALLERVCDTAQELGMKSLVEKALALQRRAQDSIAKGVVRHGETSR